MTQLKQESITKKGPAVGQDIGVGSERLAEGREHPPLRAVGAGVEAIEWGGGPVALELPGHGGAWIPWCLALLGLQLPGEGGPEASGGRETVAFAFAFAFAPFVVRYDYKKFVLAPLSKKREKNKGKFGLHLRRFFGAAHEKNPLNINF